MKKSTQCIDITHSQPLAQELQYFQHPKHEYTLWIITPSRVTTL